MNELTIKYTLDRPVIASRGYSGGMVEIDLGEPMDGAWCEVDPGAETVRVHGHVFGGEASFAVVKGEWGRGL